MSSPAGADVLPRGDRFPDGKPVVIDLDVLDHDHRIIRVRHDIAGIHPHCLFQGDRVLLACSFGLLR